MDLDLAIVRNAVNVDATNTLVADAAVGAAGRLATRTRAQRTRMIAGYVREQSRASRAAR